MTCGRHEPVWPLASEESRLKRLGDNYIENGLQPLYIQNMYLQMDILYKLHLVPVLDALLFFLNWLNSREGGYFKVIHTYCTRCLTPDLDRWLCQKKYTWWMKNGELCPFLPNFSSFVHQGGEEILSLTSTRKADKKKIDRFVVLWVQLKISEGVKENLIDIYTANSVA